MIDVHNIKEIFYDHASTILNIKKDLNNQTG